ncbi:TetR/AcrR family transcriptional regulator [Deinococcus piscis]|nr:TetR/AcrR family transcriptional regulator [Deinococcus piscis]
MPYPAKLSAEAVLDAAQRLLEHSGPDALTMRALADALGVRPSSLYRHFSSREVLLRALGDQAALNLKDQVLDAAEGLAPRAALLAAAQAYLAYTRTHPHLYALLLTKENDLPLEHLQHSPGKILWNTLLLLIGRLSGDPDDTDHAVAFWTFLHGFASLEAAGTFGQSGPKRGFEVGLEALFNHMEEVGQAGKS